MNFLLTFILVITTIFGDNPKEVLDNNTAFFEGAENTYLFYPPKHYVLDIENAKEDGYSFAFIVDSVTYGNSDVKIGVNFFKVDSVKFDFGKFLLEDTLAIRNAMTKILQLKKYHRLLQPLKGIILLFI